MTVLSGLLGVVILIGLVVGGVGQLIEATARGEPPILGLILLALPLFALARGLVDTIGPALVRGWRYGGRSGQRKLASTLVWIVACAGVLGVAQLTVPSQRPDVQLVAALKPACAGNAVAGAGTLDRSGSRPNHLVVLDTDGNEHAWTGFPPMAWRPSSLADAELVACISAKEVRTRIEVCRYANGPDINRYRVSRDVRIVEAATGHVLSQYSVGDDPRRCGLTENRDLTELSGSMGWGDVAERCQSFVTSGKPGQHTPGATPGETIVVPTAHPTVTAPLARRVTLTDVLDMGLVDMRIQGDGLQSVDLELRSLTASSLILVVPAGTMFDPQNDATQSMVVTADTEINLAPGENGTGQVPVACAEMRRDQPSENDSFGVRTEAATGDLAKLLTSGVLADEEFRIQQFAIWTITNNPLRRNYGALGSSLSIFGTGPTNAEFDAIRELFEASAINPLDYKAFR